MRGFAMPTAMATVIFVVVISNLQGNVHALIPVKCADPDSIRNKECCPNSDLNAGPCGVNLGRGNCENVDRSIQNTTMERFVRNNWPQSLFTRVCKCNGNYGGFDCGECKFGYRGNENGNCVAAPIRRRRPVSELSDDEWREYVDALIQAKANVSPRYVTIAEEPAFDDPSAIQTVSTTVYNLFVWAHHYAAKNNLDNFCESDYSDYAHEAVGFPTWHRLFLLWFEREMQHMLNNPNFTLHYWDWRNPSQESLDNLFTEDRLGSYDNSGTVQFADYVWDTVCWRPNDIQVCDATISTGVLRRCPNNSNCLASSTLWPTHEDVESAVAINVYDNPPYDPTVEQQSFRNRLEGFVPGLSADECNTELLCSHVCGVNFNRLLHNTVHIILGIGNLKYPAPSTTAGVMGNVAASPNDPAFMNHHAMVDCIFEEWLKQNPQATQYPMSEDIAVGHRHNDYIVPFIPLYTHDEMFKQASEFGYQCSLSANDGTLRLTISSTLLMVATILTFYLTF